MQHGGYASARASFSDDVTLARHLAARGARVGFLDGSEIIRVRSYVSLRQMWREWGRSFDLKDATPPLRRWIDLLLVWSTQALPLPLLIILATIVTARAPELSVTPFYRLAYALLLVNAIAFVVRLLLLVALRGSYTKRGLPFWCSWLADIPAAVRLTMSTVSSPDSWRGRTYHTLSRVTPGP